MSKQLTFAAIVSILATGALALASPHVATSGTAGHGDAAQIAAPTALVAPIR